MSDMYYRISKKSDILNYVLLNFNSGCTGSHITLHACAKKLKFLMGENRRILCAKIDQIQGNI